MSLSSSGIKGGQPSTTQPIAGPWLSPKVVTRKRWPKLLKDMGARQTTRLQSHQNVSRETFLSDWSQKPYKAKDSGGSGAA
jgi:hypothetical protein